MQGDSLHLLRDLPDGCVDLVLTDPPYGLSEHAPAEVLACLSAWCRGEEYQPTGRGFMGKAWDAWVPGPAYWREALRVLKPGGHLLAFAGSRTQDLMGMALRRGEQLGRWATPVASLTRCPRRAGRLSAAPVGAASGRRAAVRGVRRQGRASTSIQPR